MPAHFGCYPHHIVAIACRCGNKGCVVWEDVPHADGARSEFVRIEGSFFERIANRAPRPIELVCNGCGTVQVPVSNAAATD